MKIKKETENKWKKEQSLSLELKHSRRLPKYPNLKLHPKYT